MKEPDHFLSQLFSLARQAPAREATEIPFGMETAVLAHWRSTSRQNGGLLRGLRWAALIACVAALLAGALDNDQFTAFQSRFDPEARVADSAIAAGYGYE
jgi:hypothetical protein